MKSKILLFGPFSKDGLAWSNFGAPPLGIHRIASYLRKNNHKVDVVDPDLEHISEESFQELVSQTRYDFIGISPTHLTLENDLSLAYLALKYSPESIVVAGGQEATFAHDLIFDNSPVNLVVRGEGEKPMLSIAEAKPEGKLMQRFGKIPGLIIKENGKLTDTGGAAPLNSSEFEEITLGIDFKDIPYNKYWDRTRGLYEEDLNDVALRKKRLQEIYAMRLFETNYCPRGCAFCSSTNFQNAAAGKKGTKVVSLSPEAFIRMIESAYLAYPSLKRALIQSDNFLDSNNSLRLKRISEMIKQRRGETLPEELSFICQSRVDNVTPEKLGYLREANFVMIGFGVESFSKRMLDEFNKRVEPQKAKQTISNTLSAGILPYINVILTSPKSTPYDLFHTIDRCVDYVVQGAEVGSYLCVIPIPGSAFDSNPEIQHLVESDEVKIPYTNKSLLKKVRILPQDPLLKELVYRFNEVIDDRKTEFAEKYNIKHIPARVNTLVTFSTLYSLAKELKIPKYGDGADKQVQRIESMLSRM
jgi:radical SAM superfamily enzyme YgiQ (UPF0313 family)